MSGTIAPIGTYSFHATKTITTGEGGAVTTHDDALAERMRLYRSHGMARTRYMHVVAGHTRAEPSRPTRRGRSVPGGCASRCAGRGGG